jgi:cellulose synthase/poly-beta-1,6-N-acetylglucosamine synthase-like glycosyltransferase/peptidoglycan/xylan/chitin deacetylase (PgdA/CDA1 family)
VRLRKRVAPRRGAGVRRPPAHRGIIVFCLGVLALLLLAQGFSTRTIGASGTPGGATAKGPVADQGPLLIAGPHGLVRAAPGPGRKVALTFDDGPSRWTPRVAAVLKRFHVPATFFVVGSQAQRFPDTVRQLQRDGFELGNHTFTHADLGTLPGWEAQAQVGLTESVLAGTAGIRSRLLRPPYSSTPEAVTPREAGALLRLARDGYVIALSNFDSEDWNRPGVADIVRRATPPGRTGGIVLMHDGGGNRSETVAALSRLIPRLRARGFQFVTVSQAMGLAPRAMELPATGGQQLRGELLVGALGLSRTIVAALTVVVLIVGVLVALRMLGVLALARRHVRRTRPLAPDPGFAPAVSIVVPAYEEAVGIARAVRSLAGVDYPRHEVIVVDDGSTDGTGDVVEALGLDRVRVLRQPNRGKAAALNAGVAAAAHQLIVTVDADTVFEPNTLRRLVQPFRDDVVGAVSGNTKVANRRGIIGRWQHLEYVVGFNIDRRMYEVLRCMPTVPGAIGAFRRRALVDAGGFSGATLAEDTDVTLAIGRAGWHVVYAEDARAWTEAPTTLGGLWRQRYRWAYGTIQSIWKHRAAIVRRGEGPAGRRAIPYMALFQVILPLAAPLIDLFALYGILFLDPVRILIYWLAFNALQLVVAWYAFRLDREPRRTLVWLPLQQLVYRQIMYLVVIESVITAIAGTRVGWQHVERTGEAAVGKVTT